jgi:hypothetical protein
MPWLMSTYVFIDESGDLDFGAAGSAHFQLVCVIGQLTDGQVLGLQRLRRRLLRDGHDIEYFHATVNKSAVRAEVYRVLTDTATPAKILALVITKARVAEDDRNPWDFYAKYLSLAIAQSQAWIPLADPVIITDSLPIRKKREGIIKALKQGLTQETRTETPVPVYHHASKAHFDLQAVDYFGWAIWRNLSRGESLDGRLPLGTEMKIVYWPPD